MADFANSNDVSAATGIAAVVLDAVIEPTARGLLVGVAGNVAVTMADGSTGTIALPAGIHPLQVTSIATSGTTATGLFTLT